MSDLRLFKFVDVVGNGHNLVRLMDIGLGDLNSDLMRSERRTANRRLIPLESVLSNTSRSDEWIAQDSRVREVRCKGLVRRRQVVQTSSACVRERNRGSVVGFVGSLKSLFFLFEKGELFPVFEGQ